jgi:uncharacterized RDD family membrane protein YckC
LRSALAANLGVQPQQVVVTSGADEALFLIASVYLGPGRTAVVADPSFSMFRVVTESVGGSLTRVAVDASWDLPRGPLLAFLLVQNGGYLVAFTAGGQTLGKMATGIRVVGTESAGELDLGRAFMRTLIWFVLAIPAGLGFLTLLSRDHRGLHDRFAGTRVVRASA